MTKKYPISLFIFRRDLRIHDNTALGKASEQSEKVISCFIFNPEQIGKENSYRSIKALHFMVSSLKELSTELRLNKGHLSLFYGYPQSIVENLLALLPIRAVFVNNDYTPYSIQRDTKLKEICLRSGVDFLSYDDVLFHAPQDIKTATYKPYQIFTPFFKKSSSLPVQSPRQTYCPTLYAQKVKGEIDFDFIENMLGLSPVNKGGRNEALTILRNAASFADYGVTHDFPAVDTTHLSPHNKFGTVSIREVFYALTKELSEKNPLLRQLYWRDFFTTIIWYYPWVLGHSFHKKFDQLPWNSNESDFQRWCTGTTGFPLVDAGMRQLNETGFMHNRARLVVGSFLVKDLHINWQWGEKYFAQHLIDYDPAVNNGNWQWVASTGCDSQPYFRIFNPWLQQKKFDPECVYIKRWIPELRNQKPKSIHAWYTQKLPRDGYPVAMLSHAKEAALSKALYKKIRGVP